MSALEQQQAVEQQLRAQLTRKMGDGSRLGLSLFSDFNTTAEIGGFDAQGHEIGPIYKQSIGPGWGLTAGMLFGLSDAAADTTWRLMIDREF